MTAPQQQANSTLRFARWQAFHKAGFLSKLQEQGVAGFARWFEGVEFAGQTEDIAALLLVGAELGVERVQELLQEEGQSK